MKSQNIFLFLFAMFNFQFLLVQNKLKMEKNLYSLFQKTMENELLHNTLFRLESKTLEFQKSWALGHFNDGKKVEINSPFHIASLGKTFTALTNTQNWMLISAVLSTNLNTKKDLWSF